MVVFAFDHWCVRIFFLRTACKTSNQLNPLLVKIWEFVEIIRILFNEMVLQLQLYSDMLCLIENFPTQTKSLAVLEDTRTKNIYTAFNTFEIFKSIFKAFFMIDN